MNNFKSRDLILISFFTFFLFHHINGQEVKNPLNNHTYEYIPGVYSWSTAAGLAANSGGYLATITSQAEYEFIRDEVLKGNTALYGWLGAHSNNTETTEGTLFKWQQGPEAGLNLFDRRNNKCYSFCVWLPYQPDVSNNERYLHLWSQSMMNDVIEAWGGITGYIIEKGGATDPIMIPPDTDGDSITFTNLAALKRPLNIFVKSLNGKTDFACPITFTNTTHIMCTKPVTMSGEYNITITDSTGKPWYINRVHPNLPYISTIIPGYKTNDLVTINGESFSDDLSEIDSLVATGGYVPCTPTRYLVPHRSIECKLTRNVYSTIPSNTNMMLDYNSITINGLMLRNTTRVPHYNKATSKLYSYTSNDINSLRESLNVEGKTGYVYSPYLASDYQFVMTLYNTLQTICFKGTYAGNSYIYQNGPLNGQAFMTNNICAFPSGCQVDPSVLTITDRTIPLSFLATNLTYFRPTTTYPAATCRYSFAFDVPTAAPSFLIFNKIYLVPTKGGTLTLPMYNIRLTSNSYTAAWTGRSIPTVIYPVFRPTSAIIVNVPAGTGPTSDFKINIDGLASTNGVYVGYIVPSLANVTNNALLAGSTLVLDGDNLGNDVSKIVVSVTNNGVTYSASNVKIETDHTKVSFSIRSGYGSYVVKVTVAGQDSGTVSGTYGPPVITNVVQNINQFTMIASNFGSDVSQIKISLGATQGTGLSILNSTAISFTLADNAVNGNFVLDAYNLTASISTIKLIPYLVDCPPTVNGGGVVVLTGKFLDSPSGVFLNGKSLTMGTKTPTTISITIPAGSGISGSINMNSTTGMTSSNSILFYYLPSIQTFEHTGTTTVFLNGQNFWPNTKVTLPGTSTPISTTYVSINRLSFTIPVSQKQGTTTITIPSTRSETASINFITQPAVTSITTKIPTTGGKVTVTGMFLSTTNATGADLPVSIMAGTYDCTSPTTIASDNTKLECLMPPGSGQGLSVSLSINFKPYGSAMVYTSYAAPVITSVVHNGFNLILNGTDFGPLEKIVVKLNNAALTCASVNATSISCAINQQASSGPLVLTAGGQLSNTYQVLLTPQILSMSKAKSTATAITLTGNFFRNVIGSSYSGSVGSTICTKVTNIANTDTIECTLPSSSQASTSDTTPSVSISIASVPSNSIPYAYTAPTITTVTQNSYQSLTIKGDTLGNSASLPSITLNSVTLTCKITVIQSEINCTIVPSSSSGILKVTNYGDFDTQQFNLKPILLSISSVSSNGGTVTLKGYFIKETSKISIGTYTVSTYTVVDDTSITFTLSGTGINLLTIVTTNNGVLSTQLSYSFLPELNSITHDGDDSLTITGKNFDQDSIVKINSKNLTSGNVVVESETTIIVAIPLSLLNGNASVTSQSFKTGQVDFKLVPNIKDVTSISTSGGSITIFGNYLNTKRFDNSSTTISIVVGSMPCDFKSDIGDNTGLICNIPAGTGSNYQIKVTIDGKLNVGSALFSYGRPTISSATQNYKIITIQGQNLGSKVSDLTIQLNNLTLSCEIIVSDTMINCSVPQNGASGNIVIDVLGQKTNALPIYLSPIITSMKPAPSNSEYITLTGWYFRNATSIPYEGTINGIEFISVTPQVGTDNIICKLSLPSLAESLDITPSISISIGGKISQNSIPFEYDVPSISSIDQVEYSLNIQGHSFGNIDSLPKVYLGDIVLSCSLYSNQVHLSCNLPLDSINGDIIVNNYGGNSSSIKLNLTPILKSVTQVSTSGGQITISADFVNDILYHNTQSFNGIINEVDNMQLSVGQVNGVSILLGEIPQKYINTFNLSINIEGKVSNVIDSNYLNPIIKSYSQDAYKFFVIGDSFGFAGLDSVNLVFNNDNIIDCIILVNHTKLECYIYSYADILPATNTIFAYVNQLKFKSEEKGVYLTPTPMNVTSAPVDGGVVTIGGHFLNNYKKDQQIPMKIVSTTAQSCEITSSNNNQIICRISSGSHGAYNLLNISLIVDQSNIITSNYVQYSAIAPSVQQVITNGKFYYQTTGRVTIQGTNFIPSPLANISIGGQQCYDAVYISSSKYSCTFNGSIPLANKYGLMVHIDCDGLSGSGNYFYYDTQIECLPNCLNSGQCIEGQCICPSGYFGLQCEKKGNDNGTSPGKVDPDNAHFSSNLSVFFSHIRELSPEGNTVLMYPLRNIVWNSSDVGENKNEITSVGLFPNTSIKVIVKSIVFDEATTIYFAGERIDVLANSLKYEVSVETWPFNSSLNSLQLIYSLASPNSSKDKCSNDVDTTTSTNTETDDLRYIEIELNDKIFITKFSKRLLVDNKVTSSNTVLLDKSDSIFNDEFFNTVNKSKIISVALNVPNFESTITIDPNFSVLINPRTDSGSCAGKKKSLWWISLIVVGAAAVISGAVISAVVIKKKLRDQRDNEKISSVKMNSMT